MLFLLRKFAPQVEFLAPEAAFAEARRNLPSLLERRGIPVSHGMETLDSVSGLVQAIEVERYAGFADVARQRLATRDESDWPILATALARRCPIWTEDADFFGCGVATWTSDRVELYLAEFVSEAAAG